MRLESMASNIPEGTPATGDSGLNHESEAQPDEKRGQPEVIEPSSRGERAVSGRIITLPLPREGEKLPNLDDAFADPTVGGVRLGGNAHLFTREDYNGLKKPRQESTPDGKIENARQAAIEAAQGGLKEKSSAEASKTEVPTAKFNGLDLSQVDREPLLAGSDVNNAEELAEIKTEPGEEEGNLSGSIQESIPLGMGKEINTEGEQLQSENIIPEDGPGSLARSYKKWTDREAAARVLKGKKGSNGQSEGQTSSNSSAETLVGNPNARNGRQRTGANVPPGYINIGTPENPNHVSLEEWLNTPEGKNIKAQSAKRKREFEAQKRQKAQMAETIATAETTAPENVAKNNQANGSDQGQQIENSVPEQEARAHSTEGTSGSNEAPRVHTLNENDRPEQPSASQENGDGSSPRTTESDARPRPEATGPGMIIDTRGLLQKGYNLARENSLVRTMRDVTNGLLWNTAGWNAYKLGNSIHPIGWLEKMREATTTKIGLWWKEMRLEGRDKQSEKYAAQVNGYDQAISSIEHQLNATPESQSVIRRRLEDNLNGLKYHRAKLADKLEKAEDRKKAFAGEVRDIALAAKKRIDEHLNPKLKQVESMSTELTGLNAMINGQEEIADKFRGKIGDLQEKIKGMPRYLRGIYKQEIKAINFYLDQTERKIALVRRDSNRLNHKLSLLKGKAAPWEDRANYFARITQQETFERPANREAMEPVVRSKRNVEARARRTREVSTSAVRASSENVGPEAASSPEVPAELKPADFLETWNRAYPNCKVELRDFDRQIMSRDRELAGRGTENPVNIDKLGGLLGAYLMNLRAADRLAPKRIPSERDLQAFIASLKI